MKPFGLDREIDKQQEESLKKKVYVKGLPDVSTKESLLAVFQSFGEVDRAFILYNHKNGTSRGFGFIEFSDEASVKLCLGKHVNIDGKELLVSKALERTKKVGYELFQKKSNARKMNLVQKEAVSNPISEDAGELLTDRVLSTSGSTPGGSKSSKRFSFDEPRESKPILSLQSKKNSTLVPICTTIIGQVQVKRPSTGAPADLNSKAIGAGSKFLKPLPSKTQTQSRPGYSTSLFLNFKTHLKSLQPEQEQLDFLSGGLRFNQGK